MYFIILCNITDTFFVQIRRIHRIKLVLRDRQLNNYLCIYAVYIKLNS